MSVKKKNRPFQLEVSKDKDKSDMILRTVSPITPQFVNLDMRDTLKISEVIRIQQNELIASGKYETSPSPSSSVRQTPMSSNWSDVPSAKTASSSTADGEANLKSNAASKQTTGITPNETPKNGNYTTDTSLGTEHQQVIEIDCDELSDTESVDCEHENGALYESSPLEGSELERIASSLTRKTLKRNNAPGPLLISPKVHAGSTAPAINSAPMRSLYGPQAFRRVPARYLYPAMGHFPQTAVHYMPTPIRRTTGAGPERVAKPRLPRAMSARRRKPVLDVFEGQVAKLAPMPAQPPSAQIEHFDVGHSDEEKATQDEMDEMEIKRRRATSALRGTISFNEESAFKFTIFQGNESNAKKKFLEVCETTWDKYMANSTGS